MGDGGGRPGGSSRLDDDLLVGRDRERAAVAAVVERVAAASPQLLVVEGDAGIGKSALCRAVSASMPAGTIAIWARGEEIERQLDFGVIDQLLREAGALGLAAPPALHRRGARPDPLAVGESILGLAEQHSRERPLVVVVDDGQWADLASVQALAFAYRRLHGRRALLVIAHRPAAAHLEPFHRLVRDGRGQRILLHPLPVAATVDLVRARIGLALNPRAAQRLHAHTGGNPLQTVTLVDELEPATLTSGLGPLPAPRSYASLVLGRLAGCSTEAEHIVSAVAVAGALETAALERMTGIGELAAPLSEAIEGGLLSLGVRAGRRVVDVAHPLVRAAVVGDLPPARLCALHAAAAGTIDDADRAFLHQLRSHLGRRPDLAADGIRRAAARLASGWELSAVELLVAAAELLGPGPARSEALLQASRWLLATGDTAAAAEVLATAGGEGTPLDRLVRGELALLEGAPTTAAALLEEAWAADPPPDVAARAAGLLATIAANAGGGEAAVEWSRRALALAADTGADAGYAMTMLVSGWALGGDLRAAAEEVDRWAGRLGTASSTPDVIYARGVLALWDGRLHECDALLRTLLEDRRVAGPGLIAASARYSLADCWYRQGRWDDALELAADLARTLDDAGQLLSSPMAHGIAASVLAGRGGVDAAREHLRLGQEALDATGNLAAALWLTTAAARVALAAGDADATVTILQPFADGLRAVPLPDGLQPWRADLVEALVATGRLDDAERELADLTPRVISGGAHARSGHARAAGVLAVARGDEAAAAAAFAAGLAEDPAATGAFARARVELAAGQFERRRGRRRAAAELLEAAAARLRALEAAPLLARATEERDACGLEPGHGGRTLTKAETAVAALVAGGLTNREVAARLYVSVKTVESHLARVFDKLGVRSRTELAVEWRVATPVSPPPS